MPDKEQAMVIGVTGLYAAGKDEVTKLLIARGFTEIDIDRLGHRALEENKAEVARVFGEGIIAADGAVDRRALGRIVFRNRRALGQLEAIVHPRIQELAGEALAGSHGDCVVNAALLFQMGLAKKMDLVIIVQAPRLTRLLRARARDGLSWRELCARFRSQGKIRPQQLRIKVDIYYVRNTRDKARLRKRVMDILSGTAARLLKEGQQ